MSRTFALVGRESEISVNYFPPIELNPEAKYKLGVVGFYTYNSIPNIDVGGNKFYVIEKETKSTSINTRNYTYEDLEKVIKNSIGDDNFSLKFNNDIGKCQLYSKFDITFEPDDSFGRSLGFESVIYKADTLHTSQKPASNVSIALDEKNNKFYWCSEKERVISIDTGTYEIKDIEAKLKESIGDENISLKINKNTLQCELQSIHKVNFEHEDSLHRLLGFSKQKYDANTLHKSDLTVQATKVVTVRVQCNITTGSYYNNELIHTVYQFGIKVAPGYAISEEPTNIIYYPVVTRTINNITLRFEDQDGDLINFRNEFVVVILELKKTWE